MEIINLKGESIGADNKSVHEPVFHGHGHTKTRSVANNTVTSIRPAARAENRVNIFIDDKFAFSLDISQVVDYKIKVGKALNPAEYEKLKKASNFGKLYQRTLEWVLSRPHSVREAKDYLKNKQFKKPEYGITDEDIEKIIQLLTTKNYLNDQKFAEYYIENRFQKKGISKKRLVLELRKKGVSEQLIEDSLSNSSRSEEEEIKKIIIKKRSRYDNDKLLAYLVRQGFSYDMSKQIINQN